MTSRKATKKCLYCNNTDHTILKCRKDTILFCNLSMREVKDKNRLHAYSKKQLLRLIVELCRGFTTPPHGTKHMVEHISPHSNKDAIVEFIHSTIAVELDKNKKECPICYDMLGRTKCRTSCGHEMCTGCFTQIFTTNPLASHTCPMCRALL